MKLVIFSSMNGSTAMILTQLNPFQSHVDQGLGKGAPTTQVHLWDLSRHPSHSDSDGVQDLDWKMNRAFTSAF